MLKNKKFNEIISKANKELDETIKKLERVQSDIDWLNSKGFDFIVIPRNKLSSKD